MSNKEKGEHDQDQIDWKQSIATQKDTKKKNHDFVGDAIRRRFESIDAQAWKVTTNSSERDGHDYAQDIIQYSIYVNRKFAKSRFNMLLGLASKHHNMDIAMELLLKSRLMTEYKNDYGENEYGIV